MKKEELIQAFMEVKKRGGGTLQIKPHDDHSPQDVQDLINATDRLARALGVPVRIEILPTDAQNEMRRKIDESIMWLVLFVTWLAILLG